MDNVTKRRFLNLGTKFLAFIPLAGVIGCIPNQASKLTPEDALKKLIFIIGPWSVKDKSSAEDFAKRFLKTDNTNRQYLLKSAQLIQSLADYFPDNTWAVNDINLSKLTKEEQEILVRLTKQLYSFVEVRFYVSNEPPWGMCQGDSNWHTRVPEYM